MAYRTTINLGLFLLVVSFCWVSPIHAGTPATTQATTQATTAQTTRSAIQPKAGAAALLAAEDPMLASWDQLAEFEPFCTKALLDFSAKPDQTVAFLKERLKPLKLEQAELEEMVKALGSDDEKVWKPVVERMQYFDPRLAMEVEPMLELADNITAKRRLIEILCDLKEGTIKDASFTIRRVNNQYLYFQMQAANGVFRSYSATPKVSQLDTPTGTGRKKQWLRADRAVVLLQHIATPDAIAILKDMATGNPDAQPTKIARAAVDSLTGGE